MLIGPPNAGTSTFLKCAEILRGKGWEGPTYTFEPSPDMSVFENVLHEMQKVIYYGISKGYLFHNDTVKVRDELYKSKVYRRERYEL
jgi:hypothetical protein